ncbi:unnamed protein product [Schistosoma curassoni]|uniref:DDE_Tnp_1_7 domain-containing protein n=1 Tax=Schistosoma curassoni TaxID=6186 RepID=A0A183JS08_9TREM|nr:unnamed protein product [Schistosoma curassoni]
MMSTPASSNIASDEVSEVEDMLTDNGEDSTSDENFFDKLIMVIIMSIKYLFPDEMESTPSFNTTMGV